MARDDTAFGRVAGEYFRDNLPAGAKIVVLRGSPTTLDKERVEAFRAALEEDPQLPVNATYRRR